MRKLVLQFAALLVLCSMLTGCEVTDKKGSGNEHMVMATLYQQSSAEYEALCYQAFNIAEIMVRNAISREVEGNLAIITDIDETVLDNSPYQARCILDKINYPERWDEWCMRAEAEAVPGAQKFFNFVADQGIEIFYITNRKVHLMQPTIDNMRRKGFPFADEAHLLMREVDNSKESRRRLVNGKYKIILLLGDNLDDFTNAFEQDNMDQRSEVVKTLRTSFGRRFIVFPNAMYGSWELLLYRRSDTLGLNTKGEARYHFLTPFPLSK
jgi:5'-nucleotidase (lipoprotein e(P4) family)